MERDEERARGLRKVAAMLGAMRGSVTDEIALWVLDGAVETLEGKAKELEPTASMTVAVPDDEVLMPPIPVEVMAKAQEEEPERHATDARAAAHKAKAVRKHR